MENFPSNSHGPGNPNKAKTEKPAVEAVVTQKVTKRKTPLGTRFKSIFFGGDAKSAVSYVARDVLLPAAKNMLFDAFTKGSERMIYGDVRPRGPTNSSIFGQPKVSYNRPVNSGPPRSTMLPNQPPYISRAQRDVGEVIFQTRDDAEAVLEKLRDIIEAYDVTSVSDYNALCGYKSSYTDENWGWTNLAQASVQAIREGFILRLPEVQQI